MRLRSKDYEQQVNSILDEPIIDIYTSTLNFCEDKYLLNNDIIEKINNIVIPSRIHFHSLMIKASVDSEEITVSYAKNKIDQLLNSIDYITSFLNDTDEIPTAFFDVITMYQKTFMLVHSKLQQFDNQHFLIRHTKNEHLYFCLIMIKCGIINLENQREFEHNLPFDSLLDIYKILPEFESTNLNFEDITKRKVKIECFVKQINTPLPDSTETDDNEQENTFNNVPIDKVREIFGVLTTNKNTVSPKGYFLKEDELNEFIDCAFLGKQLTKKIKIRLNPNNDFITLKNLFHTFEIYSKEYEKRDKKYKQEDYIKLFTEYFKTTQTVTSFGNRFSVASKQSNKILIRLEDL